jgi:replication-associated recombination protein RarA
MSLLFVTLAIFVSHGISYKMYEVSALKAFEDKKRATASTAAGESSSKPKVIVFVDERTAADKPAPCPLR